MPGAKIVPAVLEFTAAAARQRINRLRLWRTPIHLDLMDGVFTLQPSFGPRVLAHMSLPSQTSIHLMVERPEDWITACWQAGARRLIIHVESSVNPSLIRQLAKRFKVVMALRLGSNPRRLQPYRRWLDGVQVMTIRLGRQGAPFVPAQLNVLRAVRRMFPTKTLIADGAMNAGTIPAAINVGATEIVVGSALKRSSQPRRALSRLTKLVRVHRR